MNSITALIDHTDISDRVIEFTKEIALRYGVKAHLVTVVPKGDNAQQEKSWSKLTGYNDRLYKDGVSVELHMIEGNFFDVIGNTIQKLKTSLVIIGTHGRKGLMQHIFGAHIMKLVEMLDVSSLVIQDDSVWPKNGFERVLFPISSQSDFNMKMEATKGLMDESGMVELFPIHKSDLKGQKTKENLENCASYLDSQGVKYNIVDENSKPISARFELQTLAYAEANPTHLISIMANAKGEQKVFNNIDKENIILNEMGIPVLCCS